MDTDEHGFLTGGNGGDALRLAPEARHLCRMRFSKRSSSGRSGIVGSAERNMPPRWRLGFWRNIIYKDFAPMELYFRTPCAVGECSFVGDDPSSVATTAESGRDAPDHFRKERWSLLTSAATFHEYAAPMGLGILAEDWLQRFRSYGALFRVLFAVGECNCGRRGDESLTGFDDGPEK
jgi:hypothetical protein